MSNLIQFIGYGIHTGLKDENGIKQSLGLDSDILTRQKGEEKDYLARIELLKRALEKAKERSDIERDALKIFTVPDFYFTGQRSGYLQETFFGNAEGKECVLTALQKLIEGDEWKDWILVIGSNLVFTMPSMKKEVELNSIKIPFFKPKNSKETTLLKPVNLKGLTVVDAINQAILEDKLKAAFEAEDKIVAEVDNIASLAREVAYALIEDPTETGYAGSSLKIIDTIAKKINKEVNSELRKIKTEEQLLELDEQYDYEWEKALDTNAEEDVYFASLFIKGGAAAEGESNTEIIMKPFYNQIADLIPEEEGTETPVYREQDMLSYMVEGQENENIYIDPWHLINLKGEIDEEKVAQIKKNKKYGSPLLDGWNDININPIHLPINPTGIFKHGELTIALDSGLDNINQVKKKFILAMKNSLIKGISKKILTPEEEQLYKVIQKGVDLHIITSCGSEIYDKAVVCKKGGWVFNCDGHGNKRLWEEEKLMCNEEMEICDELGYRNIAADDKTGLGSAHTGLMRSVGLTMKQNEDSNLIPYGKKPKVERSSITELDLQQLSINNEKIRISDLFWSGNPEEKEIVAVDKKGNEAPLKVNAIGPEAGSFVIYNETLIG